MSVRHARVSLLGLAAALVPIPPVSYTHLTLPTN